MRLRCVLTAGVGIVTKDLINWGCNRSFFFEHQKNPAKQLDKIEDVIVNKADPQNPIEEDDDRDYYNPLLDA
ncbi:hypothetical protein [Legionella parisiensis]|uniref:Uncharacterized protein n=1 Tax=Legionella parisiensis TaxID=45071 RepID=A0A1E5JU14_9GAMM|nr:hypothetical protein [Legionella parisiensis]KTD43082.1 hypothetical protein Lpar_1059 [Legionella parisiensis]OEH47960.1 hypothetical protein lpari_00984 [Legionella parisiensis]STX77839.1 Uncharacterised protein [Legionella parisiensis]